MDFYLSEDNVTNRLIKEWKDYGKLIIAYDYDNTVFDYHSEGHSYDDVIQLLKDCKKVGAYFILFTACEESKFTEIEQYLTDNDIPVDLINDTPSFVPFRGKKPYYNILLDDRAGLPSAYRSLRKACDEMMKERLNPSVNNINRIGVSIPNKLLEQIHVLAASKDDSKKKLFLESITDLENE